MQDSFLHAAGPTFKTLLVIRIVHMYTHLDSWLTYNIIIENMLENGTLIEETTQMQYK